MILLCVSLVFLSIGVEARYETKKLNCIFGEKDVFNATENLNGSLVSSEGLIYPLHFWKRSKSNHRVCKCVARPCFRKCCEAGKIFVNSTCVNIKEEMGEDVYRISPGVHDKELLPLISTNDTEAFRQHFDVIHGIPCPGSMIKAYEDELEDFHLLNDGKLRAWAGEELLDVMGYCYEIELSTGLIHPLVCIPEVPKKYKLYAGLMALSGVLLAATFLVYAVFPSLQSIHGRSLMCHVLALVTGYVCLPIISFQVENSAEWCATLAFIIYFAFLASFFWLNVMCLDIWWTFSGFRPLRGSVKEREHKKFIIYSLYCWGSPLLMLIICLIMDLHPGIPESYEKPGFGEKKCWFRSNVSNLIYFNGPIAILIVCNIVLFILTAIKICQVKRGAKILKKQDSRRHYNEEENNTRRFNLYLKLFLVMGVNWIMEVVSFAAGGPDEWWYVTDIANTLQGVLIFIIFVWKRRIWRLLKERFWPSGLANTSSMANSSTRMTAIRRNGSEMSSGRSSLKTPEGQSMKPSAPPVRSDDSDAA